MASASHWRTMAGILTPWGGRLQTCLHRLRALAWWGWLSVLILSQLTLLTGVAGAVGGEHLARNFTCPRRCACNVRRVEGLVPERAYRTADCSNRKFHALPTLPRNIEVLIMRSNGISSFHEQLPSYLHLRSVDLSRNNIESLGLQPAFENMTSLQALNLAYNRIHSLMHGSFKGLPSLRELCLEHNHIQSIEDHSFDGLQRLEQLDLSNNQLLSVSRHWFQALPSLQELVLDQNQITSLDGAPFQPLQRLTKLSLQANGLQKLSKSTFRGLESLQNLNLKRNRFETVPTKSFTIFKRLKYLSMDDNPLTILGGKDFRDFSVAEISISFLPELVILDRESFYNLPELVALQIHDNYKLSYIDDEAFVRVPHLRALYAQNNNLLSLSPSLPQALPELHLVSLVNNPLRCDCNIHWIKMANISVQTNQSGLTFTDADRLKCDGPASVSGLLLRDVSVDDVSVTCPPTVIPFFNVSYQKELGDSITYECRAVGVTQPHIHWILSNGKAVNNTSNFSRVRLAARGSLEIQHLKPLDAGTYTCVATNENGYDTISTVLLIHSKDIHILHKGVATNFITVTWNGTDSTMSTSDYLLLYRRQGSDADYGRVYLKPYMRAYTITNLLPQTVYEFCIAYEHMEQVVKLHCIDIETKHRMYVMEGIKTLGNMTIVVALTVTLSAIVFFCLGITAVKRYRRRKAYKEPEGSNLSQPHHSGLGRHNGAPNGNPKVGHMSQIPLDNLYHPPSTPICTSRTSLIGQTNA